MSGTRQHFLPKFILKGFSSKFHNSNYFVWVYRKESEPYETNIVNVAVQKNFYSIKNNSYIDDLITKEENKFSNLVKYLRSLKNNFDITGDSEILNIAELISHLEIRTRNIREALLDSSNLVLEESLIFFQNPENRKKFVSIQMEKAINLQLLKLSIPLYKSANIKAQMKKELQPKIELQSSYFFNNVLPNLSNEMTNIVKQGHLRAFNREISPQIRQKEYKKLKWRLIFNENENLIMGDCGILTEVESEKRFVLLWNKEEKVKNIFFPISSQHLLVGSKLNSTYHLDTYHFNEEISKLSREFFISAKNEPSLRTFANNIGLHSQLNTKNEMLEICDELFSSCI